MLRTYSHITLILLIILCTGAVTSAQEIRISGTVTDASDGQPMPYVNVYLKGTTIGSITDLSGHYSLRSATSTDSIVASFVGYHSITLPIRKTTPQIINITMVQTSTSLKEVEIIPEERWIDLLMKRVIKMKEFNNPDRIQAYECKVYNKVQIDVNNIDEEFKDRRLVKPIDFVFENLDTSDLNQKVYLPVLLSESMSDFYFRRSPRATREFIRASQISGIENQSFTQYLGGMFININVYDNYIPIFEKNFVSPIANFAFATYDFVLEDTVAVEGKTCYQVKFDPKRKQELTFYGRIWIHDSSFAVKKVDMRVADDANFNWINDFYISQTYDDINGQYWTLTRDYRLVDLNPIQTNSKRLLGAFGHATTLYYDYLFDQPKPDEFYSTASNVIIDADAYKKNETYWDENRPDTLSRQEQEIYRMVDTVMSVPAFQLYKKLGYLIGTGYWLQGKFEIGPIYKFLSFNAVEGVRLRVGGRTSNEFSKKLMLEGHLAFGTLDKKFKYAAGVTYMVNKNPRRSVGISFRYDMEQLGQDPNAFAEDNFFASFFRRSPANKLTMVRELKTFYEHEWFPGFSNTVRFIRRDVFPIGDEKFIINNDGTSYVDNSLVSNEIQLYTRFAFRERYLYGEFERANLGTKYPVLELLYGYGIPGFPDSDAEYHRLQFRVKHWFNVFNIGWSKYVFETGKIWGTLPYPFLKIHEGNETFFFYPDAGNLVNYYEFISDTYASLYYTHHFDGIFLNRIPLMRKLKWREVVHGRGVWGTMTEANQEFSEFPVNSGPVNKPYFEAGVGIENIFKVGRIDAIWRLSHLDAPDINKFGIFITFQFQF